MKLKKMNTLLLLLLSGCSLSVQQKTENSASLKNKKTFDTRPSIYPYPVRPKEYPGYYTAPTPPLTRDEMAGKMQFKGYSMDSMAPEVPRFFSTYGNGKKPSKQRPVDIPMKGKVIKVRSKDMAVKHGLENLDAPFYSLKTAPAEIKSLFLDRGYYLRMGTFKQHRIPQLKPGSKRGEYSMMPHVEGEYSPIVKTLYKLLGPHFLGMCYSESDDEYIMWSRHFVFPQSRDKRRNFLDYQDYMGAFSSKVGDRMYISMNASGWHYHFREPAVTYAGTQSFHRNDSSPRVHFAFLRGASRQYGRLLGNQFSLSDHWGNKTWVTPKCVEEAEAYLQKHYKGNIPETCPGIPWHDKDQTLVQSLLRYYRFRGVKGASLNLCRRMAYTSYLYNNIVFSWEMGELPRISNESESVYPLTPLGKLYNMISEYTAKEPDPGVMHTPVALFLDFGDGWRPPIKHIKERRNWSVLTYDKGDFLTDNLFSLLFPGQENLGLFKHQRYALPDTPYGDMTDVLLSDVRQEVLNGYGLVIVSGQVTHDPFYTRNLLEDYARSGGQVIITGANASRIWPNWNIKTDSFITGKAGDVINGIEGQQWKEPYDFQIFNIDSLPKRAEAIATFRGKPVAFKLPLGKGTITVFLSPYGLNKTATKSNIPYHGDKSFDPEDKNLRPIAVTKPYHLMKSFQSLLDKNLKSQRIFSLNSDYLGYITCRKAPGHFTLGIFNDTLQSQPFKITSHIGKIKNIEEVILPDAAYIKERPEYYPEALQQHDGGTSNGTHIQSGDFRLFKIQVAEKNLRIIPKYTISVKTKRLLSMPSLFFLDRKLSVWPGFFNNFDGVKVNSQAFLNIDESSLKELCKWLNRRKVRFLIDARNMTIPEQMEELIQKLSCLTGKKDIIITNLPKKLANAAKSKGIQIYDKNIKDHFNFIHKPSNYHPDFKGITILEGNYKNWDEIYRDLKCFNQPESKQFFCSRPPLPETNIKPKTVIPKNRNHYLSIWEAADVKKQILNTPNFFSHFGGIMLDAQYLHYSSPAKWQQDADWLKGRDIHILVDFSRSVFGYDKIGFYPQRKLLYKKGMAYAENVFKKMHSTGIQKAVFRLERNKYQDLHDLDQGVTHFCKLAAQYGINLYLRPTYGKTSLQCKQLIKRLKNKRAINNLFLACNIATDPNMLKQKPVPKVVFLDSANRKTSYAILYPLANHYKSTHPLFKLINNNDMSIFVLDAEYNSPEELKQDIQLLNW